MKGALKAYFKAIPNNKITHIVLLGVIMMFVFTLLLIYIPILAAVWFIITMAFLMTFAPFYMNYYRNEDQNT